MTKSSIRSILTSGMSRPFILVLCLLARAGCAFAQDAVPAAQVKAAFVYNFTKFVTWPAGAFTTPDQPIRLGIVGDDALAEALRVVEGRMAQGRRVEVCRLTAATDATGCHLIYVARSERARFAALAAGTAGAVLTVGDDPHFTAAGGVVSFFLEGERVRVEICADRAAARGLRISSKLLQVARVLSCK